jgi:hypothetical protein
MSSDELLTWTTADAARELGFHLKPDGTPNKGKPKAFILFTFPPAATSEQQGWMLTVSFVNELF